MTTPFPFRVWLPAGVVLSLLACGSPAPPPAPEAPEVGVFEQTEPEGRLNDMVSGLPAVGGNSIAEARAVFTPEEKVLLHGLWTPNRDRVDAHWDWYDPGGDKVYESALEVDTTWQNTWVTYRGPEPMEAGTWTVRVRDGEEAIGRFAFEVKRDVSDVPVRRQALAFEESKLTTAEASTIATAIRAALAGTGTVDDAVAALPADAAGKDLRAFVGVWAEQRPVGLALGDGEDLAASLKDALGQFTVDASVAPTATVEFTVVHSTVRVPATPAQVKARARGNMGFTLKVGDASATLLPQAMSRVNLVDGPEILRQLAIDAGLPENGWEQSTAVLHAFRTQDFVLPPGADAAEPLLASRTVVFPEEVDLDRVHLGVDRTITWYMANQKRDGRYMYTFWPGEDLEPPDDWNLRVLNTVWVLAEWSRDRDRADLRASVAKAADRYIESLEYVDDDKAFVNWTLPRKDTGLGSTAFLLSTLSVLQRPGDEEIIRKLANAIIAEQDETGRLSTNFVKADRENDQLYYPGEALVSMVRYLQATGDKRAVEVLEKAFDHYSVWWQTRKNEPNAGPFVPWQIRAYHDLWRIDPQDRYRDFVFDLMDWMLDAMPPEPPEKGWDYAGSLRRMPASTGVYIEGLVHAYLLARDTNDDARTKRYGAALAGGTRYLLGLQYDPEDVYPYARPDKVMGGLATKPALNEMRLDFTYHGMNALQIATQEVGAEEWDLLMTWAYPEQPYGR